MKVNSKYKPMNVLNTGKISHGKNLVLHTVRCTGRLKEVYLHYLKQVASFNKLLNKLSPLFNQQQQVYRELHSASSSSALMGTNMT